MVNKKPKTAQMLFKIGLRTIFKQWLQFLAIVLINATAVTLFVGLCSNADNIDRRVNTLYEGSNLADVWTNVTSANEEDLNAINTIVGEHGKTETRFSLGAELATFSCNALMSESIPTINAPYECDNVQDKDFFIIDRRLFDDERHPELWKVFIDENNVYRQMDVSFNFANVHAMLANYNVYSTIEKLNPFYIDYINSYINGLPDGNIKDTVQEIWNNVSKLSVLNLLDYCLKDENSINIFNESTLTLNFQITGSMMFAENVQSSLMNSSNFLLDINLFKNKFKELIHRNFVVDENPQIGDKNFLIKTIIRETNIMNAFIDSICDSFTYNTYCTDVYEKEYIEPIKDSILYYFNAKEANNNNLIVCQTRDTLLSNVVIQNDIKQARQLAYIFPLVFFLVAILVVLTTISQIILKERTLIGTLKAIGVSKTRIVCHYLLITASIILLGSLLGCIIGPILLSSIMNVKYAILYTLPTMHFVLAIPEALISTFTTILISCIVTFSVVIKEARLDPALSMRPSQPHAIKAKAINSGKRLSIIAIKMAFRNIFINISKSLMVVLGITGCTALLVCGFGIDDTLNNGVEHDLSYYYNADITLSYSTYVSHHDEILSIDGVDSVEEYSVLPTNIVKDSSIYETRVYCLEDDSSFFYQDNDYQLKEDVVISQKVADSLNINVGDEIEFSVPLIRKEPFKGVVGAINEAFYVHGVFVNKNFNDYAEICSYVNNAFVKTNDSYDTKKVGDEIKSLDGVLSYKTRDENKETISSYMSSISLMTLAVKCFAIILAVVVLYNLALLNFKERHRDVATMKVLGFNQFEIMLSLIFEIMTLTVIGIAFGLLLGKPLEFIVLFVNRTPLVEFLYIVYPFTYIISFIITFGTALTVNLLLSLKTRKIKMVESLKSVD